MLVLSAIAIPVALAGNAHFIGAPQLTQTSDAITVTFKAAGLGNVDVATFALTGDVTVLRAVTPRRATRRRRQTSRSRSL